MTGICVADGSCTDYVIVATPVRPNMGSKTFCSTSDGVFRYKMGLIASPLQSVEDCQSWTEM
jgi:hypothetical protein